MEAWMYLAIAAAATVVPAVGLSLLVHTEMDRGEAGRQPRWIRAKSALVAAVGGATAVVHIGKPRQGDKQKSVPGSETE